MVRVWLYKGNHKSRTWFDTLTRRITGSPFRYSHAEIQFSNGIFFSSSIRDHGTRFKVFPIHADRWDCVEIPCTPDQEQAMKDFAFQEDQIGYDWMGLIFGWWLPFAQFKNRWICSEIVMACLQKMGIASELDYICITPNRLARELQRLGYNIVKGE